MALLDDFDLVSAQEDAEGEMVDECEIYAPGAEPVFDTDTETYTYSDGAKLYPEEGRDVGICKRQSPPGVRAELGVDAGDHQGIESRAQLHIPASAPLIPAGAIVVITNTRFPPSAIGRRMRVDGPVGKTWLTAQRLNVTEVVG
jgi:hypothetical protein